MRYETRQRTQYKGGDRWSWSVWIEALPHDLDQIKTATYILHPTFARRIRRVQNRKTKFRIDSSGWGGFTVKIDLQLKDGREEHLTHELVLRYPPNRPVERFTPTAHQRLRVFVSSSAADAQLASVVKKTLVDDNIEVQEASEIGPGLPLEVALPQVIRAVNLLVAILSDSSASFIQSEIEYARHAGVPVLRAHWPQRTTSIEEYSREFGSIDSALPSVETLARVAKLVEQSLRSPDLT